MNVEHGTFTPLVIGTSGGCGKECGPGCKHLAELAAVKDNEPYSRVMGWMRARLSFEVLRSSITCIRGTRRPFRRERQQLEDLKIMVAESGVCNQ